MINFPANPTKNQIFNFNGKSYQYISGRWISLVTHMLVNGTLEERLLALEAKIAARIGTIFFVADDAAPEGSLICDGRLLSRTTYADLFAKIGTTYGAGDGSTTFQLPDYRGEFLRGWDGGRGVDAGRVRGSWQNGQNLSHTHTATVSSDAHTHTWSGTTTTDGAHQHGTGMYNAAVGNGSSFDPDEVKGNGGGGGFLTSLNGGHAHTVSGTTSSYSHTHTVNNADSGGTEVRVRNKAELICIWVA